MNATDFVGSLKHSLLGQFEQYQEWLVHLIHCRECGEALHDSDKDGCLTGIIILTQLREDVKNQTGFTKLKV